MIPEKGKRYIRRDGTVTPPLIDDPAHPTVAALFGYDVSDVVVDPETNMAYSSIPYEDTTGEEHMVFPDSGETHDYDLMEEYDDVTD